MMMYDAAAGDEEGGRYQGQEEEEEEEEEPWVTHNSIGSFRCVGIVVAAVCSLVASRPLSCTESGGQRLFTPIKCDWQCLLKAADCAPPPRGRGERGTERDRQRERDRERDRAAEIMACELSFLRQRRQGNKQFNK